jgi:hypothetical protein
MPPLELLLLLEPLCIFAIMASIPGKISYPRARYGAVDADMLQSLSNIKAKNTKSNWTQNQMARPSSSNYIL